MGFKLIYLIWKQDFNSWIWLEINLQMFDINPVDDDSYYWRDLKGNSPLFRLQCELDTEINIKYKWMIFLSRSNVIGLDNKSLNYDTSFPI